MQLFRHMIRCAWHNSFHLKYLQLCTLILVVTDYCTHALKMSVMQLLMTMISQACTGGILGCCWMITWGGYASAWRRNTSSTFSSARRGCLRRWCCLQPPAWLACSTSPSSCCRSQLLMPKYYMSSRSCETGPQDCWSPDIERGLETQSWVCGPHSLKADDDLIPQGKSTRDKHHECRSGLWLLPQWEAWAWANAEQGLWEQEVHSIADHQEKIEIFMSIW